MFRHKCPLMELFKPEKTAYKEAAIAALLLPHLSTLLQQELQHLHTHHYPPINLNYRVARWS